MLQVRTWIAFGKPPLPTKVPILMILQFETSSHQNLVETFSLHTNHLKPPKGRKHYACTGTLLCLTLNILNISKERKKKCLR